MTQQTFANFIGMAPATLSSIYTGRTKPTLNTVEAIRSKLPGLNINWLMFGTGQMFEDEKTNDTSSTPPSEEPVEGMLNFQETTSVGQQIKNAQNMQQSARRMSSINLQPNVVQPKQCARRITEIRVFFDDQTYESFVPKK